MVYLTPRIPFRSYRFLRFVHQVKEAPRTSCCIPIVFKRQNSSRTTSSHEHNKLRPWSSLAALSAVVGYLVYKYCEEKDVKTEYLHQKNEVGGFKPNLKTYTAEEVLNHDSLEKRIWVTYKSGVYDITDFVKKHPGGDEILMAAGGSLEPFWMLYAIHQKPEILEMLEGMRIANLAEADRNQAVKGMNDPYALEPRRHPALRASSAKPFNAEPPLSLLVQNYITPNELFYVRNHLPVPHLDPSNYELEIEIQRKKTISLSLVDLKTKFPKHTITAAVQCAGNRRSEMIKLKPIKGLSWNSAAIGNATWSGARLRDVLKYAGFDEGDPKIKHVQFEGHDLDPAGVPYGASIHVQKAMDPDGDVLLAYEMNGKMLPLDHGYPVRVVVPGVVGARNVKWVARIVASSEESKSHWQQNDYKGFPPHIDWDTVDFKSAPAIQELPVQSAVCEPADNATVRVKNSKMTVKGYAWSGGGRGIVRVDVSVDGGKNWHVAALEPSEMKLHKAWGWSLWRVEIPVDIKESTTLAVCCRAVDSSYNTQPEHVEPIWNLRGVLNNAWHKIKVTAVPQ